MPMLIDPQLARAQASPGAWSGTPLPVAAHGAALDVMLSLKGAPDPPQPMNPVKMLPDGVEGRAAAPRPLRTIARPLPSAPGMKRILICNDDGYRAPGIEKT